MLRLLALLYFCCALPAMAAETLPIFGYQVVHHFPHDPTAFTEGLFFKDGLLYESTGIEGHSTIRKVRLETGEVLQSRALDRNLFGEGIVDRGGEVIGLTWRNQLGLVFDRASLALLQQFHYPGEGWALTRNATELFMSDGTPYLRVLDPQTLSEKRKIHVTALGEPVERLNELEWVKGEIYANIWQTDHIARIDPMSGHVVGWIDLTGLLASAGPVSGGADVLNGIAYDSAQDRLFVTGKYWPYLFEIKLKPQQ